MTSLSLSLSFLILLFISPQKIDDIKHTNHQPDLSSPPPSITKKIFTEIFTHLPHIVMLSFFFFSQTKLK